MIANEGISVLQAHVQSGVNDIQLLGVGVSDKEE